MRSMIRACVATVAAIAISTVGTLPLISNLHAASGLKVKSSPGIDRSATPVGGAAGQSVGSSTSAQIAMQDLRNERVNLVKLIAESEKLGRPTTEGGRRVGTRLKRILAILEIQDLPLSERAGRFEELGISSFYRGSDLVVVVNGSERAIRNLGRPVHPAQYLQNHSAPDGASALPKSEHEWEPDWEYAQYDAESTIVAIEALSWEAEGFVSDYENYEELEAPVEAWVADSESATNETPSDGCDDSVSSVELNSGRDCYTAVGAALAETLSGIAGYLSNSAAVNAALTNARNAVGVAMAAFTAGTLSASGLASAAVSAITALAGSTAAGWFAAGAIGVLTAVIIYEIWQNCPLPIEPEGLA